MQPNLPPVPQPDGPLTAKYRRVLTEIFEELGLSDAQLQELLSQVLPSLRKTDAILSPPAPPPEPNG